MNSLAQLLGCTNTDFGIFWDFTQDVLPWIPASKPMFIPLFDCSEFVV